MNQKNVNSSIRKRSCKCKSIMMHTKELIFDSIRYEKEIFLFNIDMGITIKVINFILRNLQRVPEKHLICKKILYNVMFFLRHPVHRP